MTATLEPSKTIAIGYETVVVATNDGRVLTGIFAGETGSEIALVDASGEHRQVAKRDVESKRISPVSVMPEDVALKITPKEFADLTAFLAASRGAQAQRKAPRR